MTRAGDSLHYIARCGGIVGIFFFALQGDGLFLFLCESEVECGQIVYTDNMALKYLMYSTGCNASSKLELTGK